MPIGVLIRGRSGCFLYRRSPTRSLTWATHLSDWRYASDFGRRSTVAVRSERRNSSGPSKRRMRRAPVPTPWRTCASEPAPARSPYFPREPDGLVVVRVEQESRVVDLEHVDLRKVTVQGSRRRDRVHPVERVRDVDDPFLLADRRDRLGERHPARDLVPEEEPDHLAVPPGLDLLAGDHDQVAVPRELDRLERAGEDVVVGDRDRAEPLRLGVVDERRRLDRAVVRVVRVHVQVGDDPLAVGERLGLVGARWPPAPCGVGVEPLEPLGEGRKAPVLDALPA